MVPFTSCSLFPIVFVCPAPDFFVCGFILPFGFQGVSQTFVNDSLYHWGCCLGYSPCLRAI